MCVRTYIIIYLCVCVWSIVGLRYDDVCRCSIYIYIIQRIVHFFWYFFALKKKMDTSCASIIRAIFSGLVSGDVQLSLILLTFAPLAPSAGKPMETAFQRTSFQCPDLPNTMMPWIPEKVALLGTQNDQPMCGYHGSLLALWLICLPWSRMNSLMMCQNYECLGLKISSYFHNKPQESVSQVKVLVCAIPIRATVPATININPPCGTASREDMAQLENL